jgi:undecaprenyl-diphosphatase
VTPLQAFILGIVEGVTEYLPVSSTGHLILTSWILGLGTTPESKEAIDAFEVIIQGGAILAVLGLFRRSCGSMVRGLLWRARQGLRPVGRPCDAPAAHRSLAALGARPAADAPLGDAEGWVLARNVVVAFLPAAVAGSLLAKPIKAFLFHPWPVVAALAAGGAVMLAISPWQRRVIAAAGRGEAPRATLGTMSIRQALAIGLLQCLAMWPGTSRSLTTILGGLVVGLRPVEAAKFSFLLGLVTLTAASGREALEVVRSGHGADFLAHIGGWLPLVMGLAAAWASAALAVDLFVTYLGRHTLALFGWWRLALAAAVAGMLVWSANGPTIAP